MARLIHFPKIFKLLRCKERGEGNPFLGRPQKYLRPLNTLRGLRKILRVECFAVETLEMSIGALHPLNMKKAAATRQAKPAA